MTGIPLYSVQIIDGSLNLVNYTQEIEPQCSDLFNVHEVQIEPVQLEIESPAKNRKKRKIVANSSPDQRHDKNDDGPNLKFRKQFKEYNRKQLFRKQWLKLDEFKDWLEETIMPDKARCKACCRDMTAGKSELLNHRKSRKHISNFYNMLSKEKDTDPLTMDLSLIDNENNKDNDPNFLSALVTRILDFRSDSISTPNTSMRRAMYENDTTKTKSIYYLEKMMAKTLQKESALFFPTHTMANLVAILAHCQSKGSTVFCGDSSEIYTVNRKALMKFGGLCCIGIENESNGSFAVDKLVALLKKADYNWPLKHVICVETAHLRKGGVVPPLEWITKLSNISSVYDVFLHCDGTRLVNASLHLEVPFADISNECHSVTIALDKGLSAPLGAIVAGETHFIHRCESLRNSMGGNIHQGDMFATAAVFALSEFQTNLEDHRRAFALSIAIAKAENQHIRVDRSIIQTNIVNIQLTNGLSADNFMERLSCVMEGEAEMCGGNSVIVFSEKIDDSTVSLRMHNNISDRDILLVSKKMQFIFNEYSDTAEVL